MMADLTSEFEPQVIEPYLRECLAHYYDYDFLQGHPLLRLLLPAVEGEAGRVQAFRELVDQAIESMKPGPAGNLSSKQARYYHILSYRYINQQQVQHVLFRLNLSERQFYRDHNMAIRALGRVLWEQARGTRISPQPSISIQSEIKRIHTQSRPEQIQVRAFLLKTLSAIHGLVERYQATIDLQVDDQLLLLAEDGVVLRQAIIWILSQLLIQSDPNSRFVLAFQASGEMGTFTFNRRRTSEEVCPAQLFIEQTITLTNLVQVLEGRFEEDCQPGQDYRLCLTVPLRKHSILIIDDNPDAIALFRHYLTGYPYRILVAYEADLALQLAKDYAPELIVLDVMLPGQDGWEILQSLKSHSLTWRLPVVICSVLDSPELARVLGADGFLRKPPSESEFLEMAINLSQQRTKA